MTASTRTLERNLELSAVKILKAARLLIELRGKDDTLTFCADAQLCTDVQHSLLGHLRRERKLRNILARRGLRDYPNSSRVVRAARALLSPELLSI